MSGWSGISRPSSRLSLHNNNPIIEIGDRVTIISSGLGGVVKFSGSTSFSNGHWVGVQLDKPVGKNDGSVDGIKYFETEINYGMFVRSGQLQLEKGPHKSIRPGKLSSTSPSMVNLALADDNDAKPHSPNASTNSARQSESPNVKPLTKTKPVSPRITRSRAAKVKPEAAAESLASELAPKRRTRSAAANSEASKVPTVIAKRRPPSRAANVPKSPEESAQGTSSLSNITESESLQSAALKSKQRSISNVSDNSLGMVGVDSQRPSEMSNNVITSTGEENVKIPQVEQNISELESSIAESAVEPPRTPAKVSISPVNQTPSRLPAPAAAAFKGKGVTGIPSPIPKAKSRSNSPSFLSTMRPESTTSAANFIPASLQINSNAAHRIKTMLPTSSPKPLKVISVEHSLIPANEPVKDIGLGLHFQTDAKDVSSEKMLNDLSKDDKLHNLPQKEALKEIKRPSIVQKDSVLSIGQSSVDLDRETFPDTLANSDILETVAKLAEKDKEINRLKAEVQEIKTKSVKSEALVSSNLSLFQAKLSEKDQEIKRLKEVALEIKTKSDTSETQITSDLLLLQEKISEKDKEIQELKAEIQEQKNLYEKSDSNLASDLLLVQQKYSEKDKLVLQLESEIQDHQAKNEKSQKEIRDLEGRLGSVLDQMKTQETEVNDLRKIIEDRSQNEAIQAAYNNLLAQYEASKLDVENERQQTQKLKTELKNSKLQVTRLEEELDNRNDAFELAVVDKCVAEENLELVKAQNSEMKAYVEELKLEKELRIAEPLSGDENSSVKDPKEIALLNERLTEALIKLRDVSTEKENELNEKIALRDKDIIRLSTIEETSNGLADKLKGANEKIELLKAQLDTMHESTYIITSLTETNLALDESLAQQKIESLELEQLRRLNNDLEAAHLSLEEQLYKDSDFKEKIIRELVDRFNNQTKELETKTKIIERLKKEISEMETSPVILQPDQKEVESLRETLRLSESQVHKFKTIHKANERELAHFKKEVKSLHIVFTKLMDPIDVRRLESSMECDSIASKLNATHSLIRDATLFNSPIIFFKAQKVIKSLQVQFSYLEESKLGQLFDILETSDLHLILDKISERLADGDYNTLSELTSLEWFVDEASRLLATIPIHEYPVPRILQSKISIEENGEEIILKQLESLELRLAKCRIEKEALDHFSLFSRSMAKVFTKMVASCQKFTRNIAGLSESHQTISTIVYDDINNIALERDEIFENTIHSIHEIASMVQAEKEISYKAINQSLRAAPTLGAWEVLCSKIESLSIFRGGEENTSFEHVWMINVQKKYSEISQIQSLKLATDDLNAIILSMSQDTSEKVEFIGALETKIEILEKKLEDTSAESEEMIELKSNLKSALSDKEEYQRGLEALHEDLKDAERDNEELRKLNEKLSQGWTSSSPKKSSSSNTLAPDIKSSNETDVGCIRFLLMENARLKANEYSQVAFHLFHPADPVMKRQMRSDNSPNHQRTKELQELKDKIKTNSAALESLASQIKIVNISNPKSNSWRPKMSDPEYQWRSQQERLKSLIKISNSISEAIDDAALNKSIYSSIGSIVVPATEKQTKPVFFDSLSHFAQLHTSLVY